MIILKPVECAVLQWACLFPPQQSLPLWEYSFDTKRKMEELGSSQETGYRTMTPFLRTGYCQSSTACLRVTRVERAPFHMMCEEDNWLDSCLQVKKKNNPHTKEFERNKQITNYIYTVTCSDAGTTTCHYPGVSQQGRRVTSNTKPHCTEKQNPHTKHSLQTTRSWAEQIENTSKTPRMLKFLLEVMNGNHVGLRLPALAQIRPSEAADRGKDCLYLDCEVASSPRRYTRCVSQAVWAEQTWSGSNTWAFFLGTHGWEGHGGLDQFGVLGYSLPSHPANLLKGFPPVFVSLPTMSDLKKRYRLVPKLDSE